MYDMSSSSFLLLSTNKVSCFVHFEVLHLQKKIGRTAVKMIKAPENMESLTSLA